MKLTARQLAHLVGGRLVGDGARAFTRLFSDSRQAPSDARQALFVALRGERFDGNDFAAAVLASGVGGAIVTREVTPSPDGAVQIVVADTQAALEAIGAAARTLHPGVFVAITGSVGKTTAKEMAAAALAAFGKVGRTQGNLNNHIGVPLTLANLDGDERFVVVEEGMSAPGEIARLTHLSRPAVGLVTRAAAAHLEFFADVDAIADAKGELYEHLPPGAIAIVNADDARMVARAPSAARAITYGRAAGTEVRVIDARHRDGRLAVRLAVGGAMVDVSVASLGLHNAENVAAALAVVTALGLDPIAAATSLGERFRPSKHRLEMVRVGALTVLDDCYNANPTSTLAALDTFHDVLAVGSSGRDQIAIGISERLAVLGSMRELGPTADALHGNVGRHAATIAGTVIATGPHAAALADAARDAGADALAVADLAAAFAALDAWVAAHPRGAILLKGSRGERLERALDHLASASSEGAR